MSQAISLIVFGMLGLGLMKAFRIAGELAEIKELLRDIKRNTSDYSAAPASPVNLARAVNAEESEQSKLEHHKALLEQALKDEAFPE
jgi:hypothetical protein